MKTLLKIYVLPVLALFLLTTAFFSLKFAMSMQTDNPVGYLLILGGLALAADATLIFIYFAFAINKIISGRKTTEPEYVLKLPI